eukprot:TRINITY_DN906_c0_g1_i1.p1 TRINITY_DN906_c0_g1~~TRINITY_DN906_c0_g1_i1.p1  ORF type:complete len:294 (+),score=73.65 TRINITY_DN906_c0_g1_i1:60-941(+)
MAADPQVTLTNLDRFWESNILPTLSEYIKLESLSPLFDAEWASHGKIDAAAQLLKDWAEKQGVTGLTVEIVRLEGLTPVIYAEVPATAGNTKTALLYGHMDKQPPMTEGWSEGLGPWTPVFKQGPHGKQLFGRGGADDGYALFASVAAIKALQDQGASRPRCVILIEGSEESGSVHLPPYIAHLQPRIGNLDLIVCLDSGAGNYEQFWLTTSLRGLSICVLKVEVLEQAVHSGIASGIVPSSFRIVRSLIDRLEDQATGVIKVQELHADIPPHRVEEAKAAATVLADSVYSTV